MKAHNIPAELDAKFIAGYLRLHYSPLFSSIYLCIFRQAERTSYTGIEDIIRIWL